MANQSNPPSVIAMLSNSISNVWQSNNQTAPSTPEQKNMLIALTAGVLVLGIFAALVAIQIYRDTKCKCTSQDAQNTNEQTPLTQQNQYRA